MSYEPIIIKEYKKIDNNPMRKSFGKTDMRVLTLTIQTPDPLPDEFFVALDLLIKGCGNGRW